MLSKYSAHLLTRSRSICLDRLKILTSGQRFDLHKLCAQVKLSTQLVMHSQWIILVISSFCVTAFAQMRSNRAGCARTEAPMILICRTVEIDKTLGYDPAAGGTMDPNIFFQWAMGVPAAVRRVRSDRAEAAPAAATPKHQVSGDRRSPAHPTGRSGRRSWRRVQSGDKPASLPIVVPAAQRPRIRRCSNLTTTHV